VDENLVIGQVAAIKGEEGLEVQVNQAGDKVLLEPGNAHKLERFYKLTEFLDGITISKPAFSVSDPVFHKKDGRIGKVASVGSKTIVVGFGKTFGSGTRCKPEDLVNLFGLNEVAINQLVAECVGLPLGDESVSAPEKAVADEDDYEYGDSGDHASGDEEQ
jgi:hypothetical protein